MAGIMVCVTQSIIAGMSTVFAECFELISPLPVLLVLRCYALYYGNKWVLVGMSALGLTTVAIALVSSQEIPFEINT